MYYCPEAAVICADFTKSLGAAIAAKALCESRQDEATQARRLDAGELPDIATMTIGDGAVDGQPETTLQLCE